MTGELSQHDYKNCWLLCKELAQTNSTQSNHSCCVWFLCVCALILYVPVKKSAMILCWSCTEQRSMCLAQGHNASLGPQLLGLKSSTLPPSPLCYLKKMQCSFITPVMPYGIASYFVCCMFFFLFFFYIKLCWVAHLSRVIRLPPALWRECNEPVQPPF